MSSPKNIDPTNNRVLPDNFFRPYPSLGNISIYDNAGSSNYHALQVSVNRRFAKGVQYGIAYTYSKAMSLTDKTRSLHFRWELGYAFKTGSIRSSRTSSAMP